MEQILLTVIITSKSAEKVSDWPPLRKEKVYEAVRETVNSILLTQIVTLHFRKELEP